VPRSAGQEFSVPLSYHCHTTLRGGLCLAARKGESAKALAAAA